MLCNLNSYRKPQNSCIPTAEQILIFIAELTECPQSIWTLVQSLILLSTSSSK